MALNIQSLRYVSDGVTATYALTGIEAPTELNILVIVNGLVQLPTTDYYIFEGGIIFNNIPFNGSDIELRHYNVGTSGFQGSLGDKGPLGDTGFQGSGGIIGPSGFQGSAGNSFVASEYGVELIFSSTEPEFATSNTMWWNIDSNVLSVYEVNQWVAVSSAAGSGYTGSVGFVGSTGTGYTGSVGIGFAGSIGSFAPRSSQILIADGGNLYTLNESVNSATQIFVIVNGLVQIPTIDYTVSGTSLTFVSNTPIIGSDIEVRYFGSSQGEFGYKGSVGYQGSVGNLGSTGFRGSVGAEGSQGPQGNPGGDRGYTGSVGTNGTNGTNGSTGFVGSRGVQGEQGATGAPKHVEYFVGNGNQTQFQSIYSIETAKRIFVMVNGLVQMPDVDYIISPTNVLEFISTTPGINADIEIRHFDFVGYAGSEGTVGYRGSVGFRGSVGTIGITGFSGSVGDRGLPGGDQGYTGSRGTNGTNGDTGFVGSKGFAGSQGFAGAPKANQTYIADGITSQFSLNRSVESTKSIFVMVNGLVLIPDSDYSISGFFTLILNDTPNNLSDIEIRYFDETGYSGSTGTTGFRGSVGYSGSNGYAEVFMGPNAPPNPEDGTLWWDTDNGILNIYYEDEQTWVGIAEGPRGPRGFGGYIGSTGGTGYTGSQGISGAAVDKGYDGSQGYYGSTGYTGSIGYIGSVGYVGSQGISGAAVDKGYDGSQGYYGSTGYTGSIGIGYAGSQGIDGAAVDKGYAGSQGYYGSVGYTGSLGIGYAGSRGVVGYVGSAGTGGGDTGASLSTRATFTGTTSSLAAGASASLNIQAHKGYAIYKIQVDGPSWVRVYSNSNSRTADASRLVTDEPNYNAGVIAEIVTTTAKTISFTPATIGFNDENPVSNIIPLTVSNDSSGSRAVAVTLTLIQLESE